MLVSPSTVIVARNPRPHWSAAGLRRKRARDEHVCDKTVLGSFLSRPDAPLLRSRRRPRVPEPRASARYRASPPDSSKTLLTRQKRLQCLALGVYYNVTLHLCGFIGSANQD